MQTSSTTVGLLVIAGSSLEAESFSDDNFSEVPASVSFSVFCSSSVDFPFSGLDDFPTENKEDMHVHRKVKIVNFRTTC